MHKVHKLEKENSKLHKIIDKFIHWICVKFDIAEEDNLIRDFQRETNTFLDPEKQIKHEEMEKRMGFRKIKNRSNLANAPSFFMKDFFLC